MAKNQNKTEKKALREEKKAEMRNSREPFSRQIRKHKGPALVYFVLRLLVVITMVTQFFYGNYENVFLCVWTLLLFLLPGIVRKRFNVELPSALEIIVLLFIFAAEILGEIREFYIVFPYWDTMLHTINGFMAAAIGFAMVDILNSEERVSLTLSPFFVSVVAFCFSMTIGVLWEFFEFGVDFFLRMDMQKDTVITAIHSTYLNPEGRNIVETIKGIGDTVLMTGDGASRSLGVGGYLDIGLYDTMEDLFVNFIGAVVFSVIGYFYVKSRGKNQVLNSLILKKGKARNETDGKNTEIPVGKKG